MDDGLLDLVLVQRSGGVDILRANALARSGAHVDLPFVEVSRRRSCCCLRMHMCMHMHMHMHVHMHMGTQVWSRTTRSGRRTTRRCGTKRRRSARQRQLVRCTGAANTPIAIEGCSS